MGVRTDRQLRVPDRARRGLAAVDPRRGASSQVFDRSSATRQGRSFQGFWRARASLSCVPNPSEREGYVPNVVYTCGAMRHNDQIILPYAVSDTFSNFATIEITALIDIMDG